LKVLPIVDGVLPIVNGVLPIVNGVLPIVNIIHRSTTRRRTVRRFFKNMR
jgi:hypothetical protein